MDNEDDGLAAALADHKIKLELLRQEEERTARAMTGRYYKTKDGEVKSRRNWRSHNFKMAAKGDCYQPYFLYLTMQLGA